MGRTDDVATLLIISSLDLHFVCTTFVLIGANREAERNNKDLKTMPKFWCKYSREKFLPLPSPPPGKEFNFLAKLSFITYGNE